MNFYPHHISDFNNATRHLTRVERSVYRDAIELYYDTESVLTENIERLAKRLLCVTDEEKTALKDVLEEFFELHDGGYFHERCDIEISKYRANIGAKAKAGIASAKARKKKAAERKQKSTRVKSSSTPVHNQEPITNNHIKDIGGKAKRFIPPTIQEVQSYCLTRNNQVDPERFIDHYTSNGWHVGKNKMKDWKASVRTWEKGNTNATSQSNNRERGTPAQRAKALRQSKQRSHGDIVGHDAGNLRAEVGGQVRIGADNRVD